MDASPPARRPLQALAAEKKLDEWLSRLMRNSLLVANAFALGGRRGERFKIRASGPERNLMKIHQVAARPITAAAAITKFTIAQ